MRVDPFAWKRLMSDTGVVLKNCRNRHFRGISFFMVHISTNEPPHDKTNKMACAPSLDSSDQPGHPPSLIRVFAVRMKKAWVIATHWAQSEDSGQTGRMPRLIWVFVGRTCHFVGFVTRRLKLLYNWTANYCDKQVIYCPYTFCSIWPSCFCKVKHTGDSCNGVDRFVQWCRSLRNVRWTAIESQSRFLAFLCKFRHFTLHTLTGRSSKSLIVHKFLNKY